MEVCGNLMSSMHINSQQKHALMKMGDATGAKEEFKLAKKN